jgi:thiol-disulfide isomerase/thioredoxin
MSLNKNLFIGLVAGIALTMVTLDIWGMYLERRIISGANPWLIEPFLGHSWPHMPKTSEGLPRPILPTATSTNYEQWMIRPLGKTPVPLSDFKGKVVFLNLWGTTCSPCIGEMPGIEKLQKSLQGEPVAFFAVTQEDEQAVRRFLHKVPMRLPVYLADKGTPEDLKATAVPTTIILDRSGNVVYRNVGAMNWDDDNARKFIPDLEKQ